MTPRPWCSGFKFITNGADETGGGGEPAQITGARRSGRGPGVQLCYMFLYFSVVSLFVDCTN